MFPIHSSGIMDIPKFLADFMEVVVGAVFIDSNRNMVETGAVINKLLGPLNSNAAFGGRPVS